MRGVTTFVKTADWLKMAAAVVAGVFFVTMIAEASTTISTSVVTAGGVYASTTADITGNTILEGTLNVSGLATFSTASTTSRFSAGSAAIGQTATTSISTAGVLSVGGGSSIASVYFGTCNINTGSHSTTWQAWEVQNYDCGSGTNGATAISGITSGDSVQIHLPNTVPSAQMSLQIIGANASTTAGFITLALRNASSSNITLTSSATGSLQYLDLK